MLASTKKSYMRRIIYIIVAVVTTLVVYDGLLRWLFPELVGWYWIASRWLFAIAVGFYVGNLIDQPGAATRRWFGAFLFFVNTGLWIVAIYLFMRLVPAARGVLSEFDKPPPFLTRLVFTVEQYAGAIALLLALFLLLTASLSFRQIYLPSQRHKRWLIEAIGLAPVFIIDLLVFVGVIVGHVSVINSLQ
jgi:hypothetical protein